MLKLKLPMIYLGYIPQDELLVKAIMQQSPISITNPNARSAKAFEHIAAELTGPSSSIREVKPRGMAAFFSHIVKGRKLDSDAQTQKDNSAVS